MFLIFPVLPGLASCKAIDSRPSAGNNVKKHFTTCHGTLDVLTSKVGREQGVHVCKLGRPSWADQAGAPSSDHVYLGLRHSLHLQQDISAA